MADLIVSLGSRAWRTVRVVALGWGIASVSLWAAEKVPTNLDDKEQLDVQSDLFWLTVIMWSLVIGLLAFAYSIRYIAKRTTRPCHWCSEFISNKASVCPRCGKKADEAPASRPSHPKPA